MGDVRVFTSEGDLDAPTVRLSAQASRRRMRSDPVPAPALSARPRIVVAKHAALLAPFRLQVVEPPRRSHEYDLCSRCASSRHCRSPSLKLYAQSRWPLPPSPSHGPSPNLNPNPNPNPDPNPNPNPSPSLSLGRGPGPNLNPNPVPASITSQPNHRSDLMAPQLQPQPESEPKPEPER